MSRKVAAYYRFSSNNQTENSIEYQRLAAIAYCRRNGFELVHEYIDEAQTGTNDRRLEFRQMILDAEKLPEWEIVVVYDYSRFARNLNDALKYTSFLDDMGIELHSVTQPFDNTNEGYMMRNMIHVLNDYYSRNNSKHTHEGMKSKAKKGLHCGGVPPLGYDVGPDQRLVINPEEATIVQLIFDCIDADYSYAKTAELLNARGYRTKVGKPFTKNSFDNILRQEKYIGVYSWNTVQQRKRNFTRNSHAKKPLEEQIRIDDSIPAIIDAEKFYRIQQKRSDRVKGSASSKARNHYMLSGMQILRCAECGSYLIGNARSSHGREYTTYACPKHKTKECSMTEINTDTLDRAVAFYIASDLRYRKDLKTISELLCEDPICDLLRNKKAGIEKSITNVLQSVSQCYCKEMAEKIRMLSEEKADVDAQIKACQNYVRELTDENIHSICNRFIQYLIHSEDVEVKKYLKATVKEILVGQDDVEISLNIL